MKATVIGAGPAGLSAALGLLRCGLRVEVLDERTKPGGRVCGGYLNAEARRHLEWLGVSSAIRQESVEVSSVILSTPTICSQFPASHDREETWGIARDRLEEILLEAVMKNGGQVRWGRRVSNLSQMDGPAVVAAGRFGLSGGKGLHGSPRRLAGQGGWYGWSSFFENTGLAPGTLALHFHPQGYIGTLVLKDGRMNVCGLIHREEKSAFSIENIFKESLALQPHFRKSVEQAKRAGAWRAVGPLPYGAWISEDDSFFAVGDAAAVGDPFMGEGLGRALGAGPMLAELFSSPRPATPRDYYHMWKKAYGGRFRLGMMARPLINGSFLRWFMLKTLIKHPLLIQKAMPVFQTGYRPMIRQGSRIL
ncbi:MAG: hypothetical protein KCHDKBKB_02604 [Elusimicrobia bacterium]|nr:hypothetical protein [Elusimicrobiota bacterium]